VKRVKALVADPDRAARPERDLAGYPAGTVPAAELVAEFAPASTAD